MTRKVWFWLAVALQVLVLLGMTGVHQYTLAAGKPVTLKTALLDPWDPFRGRYVTLSYDISQLEIGKVPMDGMPYHGGQTVWVTLQQGQPYWTAAAVSDRRPASVSTDRAVVRGTVQWVDEGNWPGSRHVVFVRYGIEQFYVPESEPGLDQHRGDFTVQVRVDRFGRAALEKVFLGDKELKWR